MGFAPGSGRNGFPLCRLSKASYCSESREMEEMVNIPVDKPISSLWAAGDLPGLSVSPPTAPGMESIPSVC